MSAELVREAEGKPGARSRNEILKRIYQQKALYLFVVPILLLYSLFSLYPIAQTFYLSFFDAKIVRLGKFMGIKNYSAILADKYFRQAFGNSLLFTFGSIVFILVVSLGLSVLVNSPRVKFKTFFKVVYFLPVVTSPIAVGYVWKWLYDPTYGLINAFLALARIPPVNWLGSVHVAMYAMIIVNVWKWIGYFMVIFLANLQVIDTTYYEAAAIDGAGAIQQFLYVTLPLLRRAIVLTVVLGIVSFIKGFALVFVMTQGGPAGRTELMATYIYRQAFQTGFLRFGYSSAGSMVLFVLVMFFTVVANKMGVEEG
ncbi:MAG: sugar ABC transporter permease [Chloroflexota bacterium]